MAFIFDHLTAILVGSALLVGLLFIQQRGNASAVETTVRYQTEAQATAFVETLARDLENARTRDQSRTALGVYEADILGGSTVRSLGLHLFPSSPDTEWIQFVTLADPDASADDDATTTSDLIAVAYRMEPTGTQVTASGQIRNLHRIVRYVYDGAGTWTPEGASPATVVGFQVNALPGGNSGRITTLPPRVDVTVEMAFETPGQRASDQTNRAESGLTRQGATARIYAAGTGNLALPASQGSTQIPRVPWIAAVPPVPPPSPPPTPPTPPGPGPTPPPPPPPTPTPPTPTTPTLPFDTTGTSAGGL